MESYLAAADGVIITTDTSYHSRCGSWKMGDYKPH